MGDFFFSSLLVKIASLKEKMGKLSQLVLVVSFSLIWAGTNFNDQALFRNHISMCSECSEAADLSENLHLICCEDDLFMHDSVVKSNVFNILDEVVPVLTVNLSNDYFQNFWKPPKLL